MISKNFLVTGLSTLVNLCCSGLVTKNDLIVYVVVKNKDNTRKFPELTHHKDIKWAKKIVNYFSYQMYIDESVVWDCPPSEHRKSSIRIINRINFDIKPGDFISENLILFLPRNKKNISICTFPEGASCFNTLFTQPEKSMRLKSLFNSVVSKTLGFLGLKKYHTQWILPDVDGRVEQFLEKRKIKEIELIRIIKKIELIEIQNYLKRRKDLSFFLADQYADFDFRSMKNIVMHTPISALSDSESLSWLKLIQSKIGEKNVLVKPHPSDPRNYKELFQGEKCIILSEKFSRLPAELLKDQMTDLCYAGFYSTLSLAFKSSEIFLVTPSNDSIVKIYERDYDSLKRIIGV